MEITIKPHQIIIAAVALISLVLGGYFTLSGMHWYHTLNLPAITPHDYVFSWAWRLIFLLTTISVIRIWNSFERNFLFWLIIALFIANVGLNTYWSYLFFYKHYIGAALIDSILIQLNVLALIYLIWPQSWLNALLLAPYAAWSAFAILLNFLIWHMN